MPSKNSSRYRWSLKALRVFEVSARLGSFTAAADELFVTQGAISKQIQKLEENLGFSLFLREANRTQLTSQGVRLANYLEVMFSELDGEIYNIASHNSGLPIIVSCEPTICLKFLIPLIPELTLDTGVEVNVLSGGGPVDFRNHRIDLAIRRADFKIADGLFAKTLGAELMGPVLHPDLTFAHGNEAESFVRIHSMTREGAWRAWENDNGASGMRADIYHQHHFLALEAAESCQGVAMVSIFMATQALHQGRLHAPLGFSPDGSEYVCLSYSPFEHDSRKQIVVDWLKRRFDSIRNRSW